jgi:hypothetical protein
LGKAEVGVKSGVQAALQLVAGINPSLPLIIPSKKSAGIFIKYPSNSLFI